MAAFSRGSKGIPRGKHRRHRRDTDRGVRWLQAGAVATGVGAAVISGQGVAVATTGTDGTDTDTTSTEPDTGPPATGTDIPGAAPATPPPTQNDDLPGDDGDLDKGDPPAGDQTIAVGNSPAVTISAQTNGTPEKDIQPQADTGDGADQQQLKTNSDREPAADSQSRSRMRTTTSQTSFTATQVITTQPAVQSPDTATALADATASAVVLRPPTVTITTTVTPPQTTAVRPLQKLVLGVLGIFGFSPDPAPGAPTPNPLLAAVWALYRRVESLFDNQLPVFNAATITDRELTDEGRVIITGTVDFDDEDGDPLRYTATNGAHGIVTVDANGQFTYTPTDPAYTGEDTFTITATDEGWHLHGLASLFGGGHTRTTTVGLTLTAADNDAPAIDDVTSEPGTGNTWTVDVEASDPNGDPVTVTVTPVDTGKVTVTPVDGEPTKFTVTVTDTAWAAANPGTQLSVIVTATDGLATTTPAVTRVIGTVNNAVAIGDVNYLPLDIPALPPGVTYVQADAGYYFTVLLRSDGKVVFSANYLNLETTAPELPTGVTYTKVQTGEGHAVLLRSDGQVETVGINDIGQGDVPELPPGVTYTDISAGQFHTVYLRSDGTAVASGYWGNGLAVIPDAPTGLEYTQIAGGRDHTALLLSDGSIVVVGADNRGQKNVPDLPPGVTYTRIAAGTWHTVAQRSDGTVVGWGDNGDGESTIPDPSPGLPYTQFDAASSWTVLVQSDGTVVAVGQNGYGQTNLPAAPAGVVYTYVTGGRAHTVLLSAIDTPPTAQNDAISATEDTPRVIAPNELLGNDSNPDGKPLKVTAVWGAQHGTTALGADGTITYTPALDYFGTDTFQYLATDGSLGDAATVTVTVAGVNDHAPSITSITSTPGTGNTWTVTVGTYDPDGDPVDVSVTTDVDPARVSVTPVAGQPGKYTVTITDAAWALANPGKQISVIVGVSDGPTGSAGIEAIGTVNNAFAIGENNFGQLDIPALPAGLTYTQVSASGHTVLLRSDGTVVGVGRNDFGQLDIPPAPAGLTYTQVSAGGPYTVLLLSDGTAISVGGNPATSFPPIDIPAPPAGKTYTQVSTANGYTAVLVSDGTVLTYGQHPTIGPLSVPTPPAGVHYTQIAAGANHLDLLRSDGALVRITNTVQTVSPPAGVTFANISAGSVTTAILTTAGNASLITGQGSFVPALPAGVTYTQVSAGSLHTVFLRSDGTAIATGMETAGQTVVPVLPTGVSYAYVAGGFRHTVLLTGLIGG